ncbi:hypothetical protein J4412_02135 [Candidatus Pacearchaeota archaeon]|nr:MAG: hypothetical protein QJ16_C0001G0011 [archaeon GW2011_AR1]MBS3078281.1 hypothetical protein [Candidatus Pacearchaeota archaeon]PIZ81697.1 MAG: hypothetical protein COX98_02770 [Candidatus Pacearchaeota archaeon CG_4_10_14_0_2_um_filter_30_11]
MQELVKLSIGIIFLILGIPIGDYLKKLTEDEQKDGQKWFRILIAISVAIGFYGLIIGNDWLLFTLFFIAIVTSRSLITKKIKKKTR